ncbi:uncharacterized protein JCM6883_002468 [Sporobolomyces salmoneus]|uniref:uncharacterized protein n=1 Tax=Sporobolomyces salmoneus TaxID=183962 RepID=UPI00316E6891
MSSFAPDLGNPLKVGKSITITGPSIYRDITPPSNYLSPAPDSWLPIRPIHRELVGPKGIAEASGTEWHLRVTKVRRIHSQGRYNISFGYISKKGRPKEGRPKEEYRVALKVSHQNLPGLAQSYKDQLDDTGDLVRFAPEIEAAYYNTYRQLQGRELQICYGMFSVMLEGALVWLTVVEDIYTSGQTSDISSWAERFRERGEPVVMTEVFGGAKYELTRGLVLARVSETFSRSYSVGPS